MFINAINYSAVIDAQAFTTATDIFECTPAADRAMLNWLGRKEGF